MCGTIARVYVEDYEILGDFSGNIQLYVVNYVSLWKPQKLKVFDILGENKRAEDFWTLLSVLYVNICWFVVLENVLEKAGVVSLVLVIRAEEDFYIV